MVKLFVTRHGSTPYNEQNRLRGWDNPPLSPKGLKESHELAQNFSGARIDGVYSSDLKRAVQTGEMIAQASRSKNNPTSALRPINFGDWNGHDLDKIQSDMDALHKAWQKDPDIHAPNGESFNDFQKRNIGFLANLLGSAKDGQQFVITAHLRNAKLFKVFACNGNQPLSGDDFKKLDDHEHDHSDIAVFNFDPKSQELRFVKNIAGDKRLSTAGLS